MTFAWILGSTISLLVTENMLYKRIISFFSFLNFPFLFGHLVTFQVLENILHMLKCGENVCVCVCVCVHLRGKERERENTSELAAPDRVITISMACSIDQTCEELL